MAPGQVFSENLSVARKVASKLEVGVSWINSYNLTPVEMPFGGHKDSGLGMENGVEVLRNTQECNQFILMALIRTIHFKILRQTMTKENSISSFG